MSVKLSFRDAALTVLKEAGGPLHYKEVTNRITTQGLVATQGKTPERTINRELNLLVKKNQAASLGNGRYVYSAPADEEHSSTPAISIVNESASGGPQSGNVRFYTILLPGTTADDLKDVLRCYTDTGIGPQLFPDSTVTVDSHKYTDTEKHSGERTLAHLCITDEGVVIASRIGAISSTVGRLFRTEEPKKSFHGRGHATNKDPRFYTNPLYPNLDEYVPDDAETSRNIGFLVEVINQSDDPAITVYAGPEPDDAASKIMISLAETGWFNDINARSKDDFTTTFISLEEEGSTAVNQDPDQEVSEEETFDEKLAYALSTYKNVLLEGVAGSGKSHSLRYLVKSYDDDLPDGAASRVEFVVFHPSSTYEDFVRGLRVTATPDGSGTQFAIEDGLFLDMCQRAWDDPSHKYLLFIDEINRANTARVLGDLLYAIEKSKRVTVAEILADSTGSALSDVRDSRSVRLLTADDTHPRYLRVPENLHILGTMNSTDRSVGSLDLALQRRFRKIVKDPLGYDDLVRDLAQEAHPDTTGAENPAELHERVEDLARWLGELNERLHESVGPDAKIGHSYFFSTPAPRDGDDEEIVDEYVQSVHRAVLDQLCEIARMFGLSRKTLDHVQSTQITKEYPGYWVRLTGAGLGQSPEPVDFNEDWFIMEDWDDEEDKDEYIEEDDTDPETGE